MTPNKFQLISLVFEWLRWVLVCNAHAIAQIEPGNGISSVQNVQEFFFAQTSDQKDKDQWG